MTNHNLSPGNQHDAEPLSPQTTFLIVKGAQHFAQELIREHAQSPDQWTVLLTSGEKMFEFQYGDHKEDGVIGRLDEWDAKILSFKNNTEEKEAPIGSRYFSMYLPLEPADEPLLAMTYRRPADTGEISSVSITIPPEGVGQIMETTFVAAPVVTRDPATSRVISVTDPQFEGQWRDITQVEGMDLLADIAYMNEKLSPAEPDETATSTD